MPSRSCLVACVPCVLLVVLTIGAPAMPALERATAALFVTTGGNAPAPAAIAARPVRPTLAGAADARVTSAQAEAPRLPRSAGRAASRDRLSAVLYSSFIGLQVLDLHSTFRALDRGAHEANPVVAPFAGNRLALGAVKMGTAAGVLYMTERVRRHNRVAALIMMAASHSVYATVVANNYRVGSRLAAR